MQICSGCLSSIGPYNLSSFLCFHGSPRGYAADLGWKAGYREQYTAVEEFKKLAGSKLLDSAIFEGENIMVDEKERYILIVEGLFYVTVWKY